MDIYEYKEMLEIEGERHFIRNMKESGLSTEEINELLEEIYSLEDDGYEKWR